MPIIYLLRLSSSHLRISHPPLDPSLKKGPTTAHRPSQTRPKYLCSSIRHVQSVLPVKVWSSCKCCPQVYKSYLFVSTHSVQLAVDRHPSAIPVPLPSPHHRQDPWDPNLTHSPRLQLPHQRPELTHDRCRSFLVWVVRPHVYTNRPPGSRTHYLSDTLPHVIY